MLRQKWRTEAGNLSGGEQQILEMAMVLLVEPTLLLLDEPSLGLSPKMQGDVFTTVQRIAAQRRHRPGGRAERARRAFDLRPRAGDGTGPALHGRAGRGGAHRSAHQARPISAATFNKQQRRTDGKQRQARLAVDIGGTFTDLALEWDGKRESVKVLTTPRAPEEGVLTGVEDILKLAGLKPSRSRA